MPESVSRRSFLTVAALSGAAAALGVSPESGKARSFGNAMNRLAPDPDDITVETIAAAEKLAGLAFTPEQRVLMLDDDPDSRRRRPGSISFVGGLHRDDCMLAVADAYQGATDFHRRRPPIR